MSSAAVALHASLRWLVLAAGLLAVARALLGWSRRAPWTRLDERLGLAFAVSMDVQWVVGVALYLGLSALGGRALASEGAEVLRSADLRWWAIAHPLLATGALALGHAARIRVRSIGAGPARHRTAALLFGAAVILLLVAAG